MENQEKINEETKEETVIEKSEIEKIAEEIEKEQSTSQNGEVLGTEEIAKEIAEELKKTEETQEEDLQTEETTTEDTAPEEPETGTKNKKRVIITFAVIGVVLALIIGTYFSVAMHYSDKFLMGTSVNGIDCSGKTIDEVRAMLQNEVEEYVLTIQTLNNEETIQGTDIGIKYNGVNVLEEALETQNHYLWVTGLFEEAHVEAKVDFEYDEAKLDEAIAKLNCLQAENQIAPVSAIPVYADGKYIIQEEVHGTQLHVEKVNEAIKNGVDSIAKTVNLEENQCYVMPALTKESPEVIAAKDSLNKCLQTNVTYSLDGIEVKVDASQIVNWLSVDAVTMAVNVDATQVRAFTDTLGTRYNTPNVTGEIISPTGKVSTVPNARLGRVVGSAAECEQLINEIKAGTTVVRQPLFSQTATPEGQVSWGTTYIEVDITTQHMWYVVNGAVALETDVVTGLKGSNDTPTGRYQVLEKKTNKTLVGRIVNGKPLYRTPVSYWMRITWSGVGFHDANWQPTFGGDRYLTNGSHGCINMPPAKAKELYSVLAIGTPVIIHY